MVTMEPPGPNPVPLCPEHSYKMTEEDVKRLIEFRASNEALFTGKRNSAKIAWSIILKGLGLEGKLTADQIAKKWDNLRTKYKDLKQPYQGQDSVEGVVESWPWFHIMESAMQGRLYNRNLVLNPETGRGSNNLHNLNSAAQLCNGNQNQENTDILEFLIKTEMEDSVAAAVDDRKAGVGPPSFEGPPLSWRRMSECSYKSVGQQPRLPGPGPGPNPNPLEKVWASRPARRALDPVMDGVTEPQTEQMIKLRAANEALFTGRKNSARPAWRAILHELGLQGRVTTEQLSKKWDNMKRRYKELRFPAPGVETNPGSWPWFYRMSDALEGRLAGAAPVLVPIGESGDDECEPLPPAPRKRARRGRRILTEFLTESEMDLLVENQERSGAPALADLHRLSEVTYKLSDDDTRRLIELRAANEFLFTGRRNSAKPAWRGIVKKMGLAGRITPDQVAKKWDNLKTKYKDLKFPPRGMEGQTNPLSWPWFQLMSDALEGRLLGRAPRVTPSWSGEENLVCGSPPPSDRECLLLPPVESGSVSELDSVVGGDGGEAEGNLAYATDASGEEGSAPSDPSYKMTDQDTRRMIRLRAANETLFTGRRNTARAAWKAILKELGLLDKVSTYQMSKKWDNLKRRYKDLRFPPAGMEGSPDPALCWPFFHLMNEAMEGRLASGAPLLSPVTQEDEEPAGAPCPHCSCLAPPPLFLPPPPPPSLNCKQEALAHGAEQKRLAREVCEAPLGVLGTEWEEVSRERLALKRERETVERERASLERERAALQAERLWLEQERAGLAQERAGLAQERAGLEQRALMMNSVGHPGHLSSLM